MHIYIGMIPLAKSSVIRLIHLMDGWPHNAWWLNSYDLTSLYKAKSLFIFY